MRIGGFCFSIVLICTGEVWVLSTAPSLQKKVSCISLAGCRVCSHTGWLEVLGCGVVDSNVFDAVNYKDVSGYAFGLGVERFAMLLHKIPDLRMLFEGDRRLLEQFR